MRKQIGGDDIPSDRVDRAVTKAGGEVQQRCAAAALPDAAAAEQDDRRRAPTTVLMASAGKDTRTVEDEDEYLLLLLRIIEGESTAKLGSGEVAVAEERERRLGGLIFLARE